MTAKDEEGSLYVALFNTGEDVDVVDVLLKDINLDGTYICRDLWKHEDLEQINDKLKLEVPSHGARFIKLSKL